MTDIHIADALRETMSDHRLSRTEKRALTKLVKLLDNDKERLDEARREAFSIARSELIGPDAIAVVEWLEEVVKVLWPKSGEPKRRESSEAFFSPDDNCVGKITRMFESAQKSVDICVFTITDDRITKAILTAHRRKISIRIISDNNKSNEMGSDIAELKHRGVPVRMDQSEFHMHHKYAIFDHRRVLTGSYNWTRSADKYNEENFVVTSDGDLVKSFDRSFEQLWKKCQ